MGVKKLTPMGDRVVIKPEPEESKTKSGIVIPDSAKEKPQEGTVIAIGDDKKIKVKAGQKVIYSKYSGNEIKVADKEYLLVKNEDILAIVR